LTALTGDLPRQKNSVFSYLNYTTLQNYWHALRWVFRGGL